MTAITYIGHSTCLIESNGRAVLTDPVFSNKVLILPRMNHMNFDPGRLPKLSSIVISHAHYDHLDLFSFKYIKNTVPIFVPEGIGSFLGKFIKNPIIELRHWATHKLPDGTEVTATPARHVGFRWTGLRYRKCNGYVINVGTNIFFAGDTGYGPHFKEIGTTYPINAALLPIGGYLPKFFMKKRHLDPLEALEAFVDLGAKDMISIHHGTFKLSLESMNQPVDTLLRIASKEGLENRVHVLQSGEVFQI